MSAFQSIQQKPDEALQTYNTRYKSYYQLPHPGLTVDDDASKVSFIHYASSECEKLGDEMGGGSTKSYQTTIRQLSKELSTLNPGSSPSNRSTQERSMRSTTLMSVTVMTSKRSRSVSRMSGTQTVKVRIMILTTKSNKHNNNSNNSSSNSSGSGYKPYNNNNGMNFNNNKGNYTEKPANVQVTLTRPVNKEQMYKIHEILKKNQRQATQAPTTSDG